MKKIVISAFAILMASSISIFADSKISETELPRRAQSFITACFVGDPVSSIEKDYNSYGTEYEVELASGAEVDFNYDGTWRKISAAPGKMLADNFVPKEIAEYIGKEYPGAKATKILKNDKGYEVELSNDHDLHFDSDAQFVRVDR